MGFFPFGKAVAVLTCGLGVCALGAETRYETVNAHPQLSLTDDQFHFYWALWRKPDERERDALNGSGALISRRTIRWSAKQCGRPQRRDAGETFFFLDRLDLDEEGRVIPLREAPRPGYRYLVMANLGSARLLGADPKPARGTRGEARIDAIHRLFRGGSELAAGFISFQSYFEDPSVHAGVAAFGPDRWPVFYDERAHKPHSLVEPAAWSGQVPVSEDRFLLTLRWDWCGEGAPRFEARVPKGGLPGPGPNRPLRADRGNYDLPVVEE